MPRRPAEWKSKRLDYIRYDNLAQAQAMNAKDACQDLEYFIETFLKGRAASLALTKLEECYMWIGKAIRDQQVEERQAQITEERSNE